MPPFALHAIVGVLLALAVKDKYHKLGLVLGSLVPDLDFALSALLYLGSRFNFAIAEHAHKLFFHSIFFPVLIALASLVFLRHKRQGRIHRFLLALSGGIFLHILLDAFYLYPIALLWPFVAEKIMILSVQDVLTPQVEQVIEIVGLALFALLVVFLKELARKRGTDKKWHRTLDVLAAADILTVIALTWVMTLSLDRSVFFVISFIPNAVFYIYTFVLLIKMQRSYA